MVAEYLDYLLDYGVVSFFSLLNSFEIVPGVSWLGISVVVTLLSIFIGSILMRV